MPKQRVIAIFDIGKTNKKLFLFDEEYNIVSERSTHFNEIKDEDGFPCENLDMLTAWVKRSLVEIIESTELEVAAVNFSAYGASLVHLNREGKPVTPLYNYLKPYDPALSGKFYKDYGGEVFFSSLTASPALGNLNSGLQLYRLKYEKPELFKSVYKSLHLPQYFSRLVTGRNYSDITSIGCHTGFWNFKQHHYHEWVYREDVLSLLADIHPSDKIISSALEGKALAAGVGLHDSSAALIPYQKSFPEPFLLLSTGTWNISLNPFNHSPLTAGELAQDCLCYLSYEGKPVKAARLFAGHEHAEQCRKLAAHFLKSDQFFEAVRFNPEYIDPEWTHIEKIPDYEPGRFEHPDYSKFSDYEAAYHRMIAGIVLQQQASSELVLQGSSAKRIFVDGGFSRNEVFMQMAAIRFAPLQVFAATVAQASALGAALAIHHGWNKNQVPEDLVELKNYSMNKKSMSPFNL